MNTFIAALAGLCASRPLDEKRLVAPSRRVGNQWLDAAARAGQPLLNVRVETFRSLAVGLAAPALAGGGLTVAPRRAERLLIDRVLRTLLREGKLPYLSRAKPGAGLAATVLSSLTELRQEDVPEDRLRKGVLEDAFKNADLKLLVGCTAGFSPPKVSPITRACCVLLQNGSRPIPMRSAATRLS